MKWVCQNCGANWSFEWLRCPSCGARPGSGRLVVGSSGKDLFPEHSEPDEEVDRLLDEYGTDTDEAEAGESDWLH